MENMTIFILGIAILSAGIAACGGHKLKKRPGGALSTV